MKYKIPKELEMVCSCGKVSLFSMCDECFEKETLEETK